MAEYGTVPSFRPDIDGPSIPTYTIMSGNELINLYISRAYASQLVEWVDTSVDPNCVPTETTDALLQQWYTDAQALYSQEGDYRVRVLDDAGDPVVIGSDVTFIVESEQIPIDPCDPGAPSCPDRVVVFQICNENMQKDDNFDIYLNDFYIGSVDLSLYEQVGSVFIASTDPNLVITDPDFACPIEGMQVYRFPVGLVRANNTLEMRNTQNNDNGNLGTIGVRNYLLTGSELSAPCTILDLNYSGNSGENFSFDFTYTECCP